MYVLNTLKIGRKTYSESDIIPGTLKPIGEYGMDDSFYGGRVKYLAEAPNDIILILEDQGGYKAIDTAVKDLNVLPQSIIQEYARRRKIPFDKDSKEELIAKITRCAG